MSLREDDINWDCYIDPPYDERADHIEVDEDGRAYLFGEPLDDLDTSFIENEDEEIKELIKKEPQKIDSATAGAILLIADKIYEDKGLSNCTQEEYFQLDIEKIIKEYTTKNTDQIKAMLNSYFDY